MGPHVYLLALDCRFVFIPDFVYFWLQKGIDQSNLFRAERKKEQVCSKQEYNAVFARIDKLPSTIEHLVLLTGMSVLSRGLFHRKLIGRE